MGIRHFKQMYVDAVNVDRRALPNAIMMQMPLKSEHTSQLGDTWRDTPKDKIMDIARKLLPLDTEFSERMKQLLVRGDICAYMHDQYGMLHKVHDPNIITFDDSVLTEEGFYGLASVYLDNKPAESSN